MNRSSRLIDVSKQEGAVCVRVRPEHLDELEVIAVADELQLVSQQKDCRKLIVSFDNRPIQCMYSVFLAKLITVQRRLAVHDAVLILAEVHPVIRSVFEACQLDTYFLFTKTVEEALALNAKPPTPLGSCLNPRCRQALTEDTTDDKKRECPP